MKKAGAVIRIMISAVLWISGTVLAYSDGDGSAGNPYQISTKADLLALSADTANYDKCFIQTANIDLTEETFAMAVIAPDTDNTNLTFEGTPFTGRFEGQGHVITRMSINPSGAQNDFLGLFGNLGTGAVVSNLALTSFSIQNSNFDTVYSIGGIAAYSKGTIRGCSVDGTIYTADITLNTGGIVGENYALVMQCSANIYAAIGGGSGAIGGLVGQNSGQIKQCFSEGTIKSYDYTIRMGGLVGDNVNGTVENSFSGAKVTYYYNNYIKQVGGLAGRTFGGLILNCYSTGQVLVAAGATNYGGLIGLNLGTVTNCFWDTQTSGRPSSAGGTGKTTAEMKHIATFTTAGWDFTDENTNGTDNIWRMCADDVSYPQLNWESTVGDFACPGGVNAADLEVFWGRWLQADCSADNYFCGGTDLNASGKVDLADFAMFAAHWLEAI
jgi:hypothetical protein